MCNKLVFVHWPGVFAPAFACTLNRMHLPGGFAPVSACPPTKSTFHEFRNIRKGQPGDRLFGTYKARVKLALDRSLGFGTDLFNRDKYHLLPLASTGAIRRSVDVEQAHLHSVQVWRELPPSFFRGAWVATGYVSKQDMARMSDIDEQEFAKAIYNICAIVALRPLDSVQSAKLDVHAYMYIYIYVERESGKIAFSGMWPWYVAVS